MTFEANTIDDLMFDVLNELCQRPIDVITTKGKNGTSEIFGAMLQLNNPRARLSRTETRGKAFGALGEFLWYMSASNELSYIEYYLKDYKKCSDDGLTIHGAYGPRLFNMHGKHNQVKKIIELLSKKPNTRQAVIQLFDAEDLEKTHLDIPCTSTLQFIIRENKLNMLTSMRSNDAYIGLAHDIFCFTMLQEIIARSLNVELGVYKHFVGSLHLYKESINNAKQFLNEGYQETKWAMPSMPKGDPWRNINKIIKFENDIRKNYTIPIEDLSLDPYWSDLATLLKIYSIFKNKKYELIEDEKSKIKNQIYVMFIDKRIDEIKAKFARIQPKNNEQ